MRQNFTINQSVGDDPLRLEIAAELEGVEIAVDPRGDAVYFATSSEVVMTYSDLNV